MTNPKLFQQILNCNVSIEYLLNFLQVIGQLERGTVISKFYYRKRPERKMLAVRRETMFVVWYRVSSSRNMYEVLTFFICYQEICFFSRNFTYILKKYYLFLVQGAVDVREIKEVRPGKNSRDFSRWPEEANNAKANRCFVVFYGSDFNLKVTYFPFHVFKFIFLLNYRIQRLYHASNCYIFLNRTCQLWPFLLKNEIVGSKD